VLGVAEAIRSGVPQRGVDYASMPTDDRESFDRGTFTECLAAGRDLARSQNLSDFRSLVDVGGGSGGLAIAMAEAWPENGNHHRRFASNCTGRAALHRRGWVHESYQRIPPMS
jgi:O-methyltransferase domain